jgi:hypothetical protein
MKTRMLRGHSRQWLMVGVKELSPFFYYLKPLTTERASATHIPEKSYAPFQSETAGLEREGEREREREIAAKPTLIS